MQQDPSVHRRLECFREVEQTGEELIVTDDDRPMLKIVPIRQKMRAEEVFGDARGRVVYHEDPVAPTSDEWPDK